MLKGRFGDTSGRPYIEARIVLPRLGLSGDLSFLVDTGADSCLLMPADAVRIGVDHSKLTGDSECGGIGGVIHNFTEPAIVAFTDDANLYVYQIEIDVMQRDAVADDVPSLLGREILDRWRMVYNPSKNELLMKVEDADFTFENLNPSAPFDPSPAAT